MRGSVLSLWGCAVALMAGGCEAGVVAQASAGSSIVRVGDRLWLSSPDDHAVVVLDAESLEEIERFAVPGRPEQLVATAGGVYVSATRDHRITRVEPDGRLTRFDTPCGGTRGLAATWAGVVATCPYDGGVVWLGGGGEARFEPRRGRSTAVAVVDGQPQISGELALAGDHRDAGRLDQLAADGGRWVGVYLRQDVAADRDRPPEHGGYGAVVDGGPRIEPWLTGDCRGRLARFDGEERVFSGPSAVALHAKRGLVWVVFRDTGNVGVFACQQDDRAYAPLLASFQVGDGARGIALGADGGVAFVDVGFDHAVSRLELPATVAYEVAPAKTVRRDDAGVTLSAQAQRGRRLFFDARDRHLTPSGVVTCGSCHPGGEDDGLTWFFHTQNVPRKLRRTLPLWASSESPLHWDGQYTSAAELILDTIRELMDGDAAGVDAAAIAAFMATVEPPVGKPGLDAGAVARGAAIFDAACGNCHPGGAKDGASHSVVRASADPDGVLASVVTPSLAGTRARGPWLHDGRAATLMDLWTRHNPDDTHGVTSRLEPTALADLVTYLETL
ncbi:MAG: c-type cytochrome [Myxococcota bacterium]